tara:strand:+ start:69 stop:545 length:477 start_codon:yes stop_codon:yes gene_type:complete
MDDIDIKYGHTPKPGEDSTTKRDAAMANVMNYLKEEEEEMDLYSESLGEFLKNNDTSALAQAVLGGLKRSSPERYRSLKKVEESTGVPFTLDEYLGGLDLNEEKIIPWTAATLEEYVTGPVTRMIMGMSEEEYMMWHYNNFGRGQGRKKMIRPPRRGK